ncbi:hypothetical protein GE09DRAFT_1214731 [Coniochaeta sp. 2T2.1]|nr:hypothetical protein GE09DRAFT_1214731 [Coniochaeta sp. 2T2.1]
MASLPPLLRLPAELVDMVAENYISPSDWKSLRLTCRFLEPSMIRLLFRRVVISKTWLDRHRFLSISRSPRLAYAARELVWYELAEDETVFFGLDRNELNGNAPPVNAPPQPTDYAGEHTVNLWTAFALYGEPFKLEDQEGGESQSELPVFSTVARDSFWLPSASALAAEDGQPDMQTWRRRVASVRFAILFESALDSMPNLTSFVCCPMPPHYIINKEVYPLTAQLFRKPTGASALQSNDGFFEFLLPAMRRPEPMVQHLTYINERSQTHNFAVRPYDVLSFSALTCVEICLESGHQLTLHQIHACLRASKCLTHLKICAEKVHKQLDPAMLNSLFGVKGYGDNTPLWPQLRKLELTDFFLGRKGNTEALIGFLRAQASTLTHLTFNYCQVSGTLVAYMASIPMNLKSLRILCPHSPNIARPSELLAHVNGTGPVPSRVDERYDDWNTNTLVYNPQHTPTLAMFGVLTHGETWNRNADIDEILEQLHPADRALLGRPEQCLYAREKLLKLSKSGPAKDTDTTAGSSDASSAAAEGPGGLTEGRDKYKLGFLFKHPDGREAKGDEPLEFFSDWEDSCDETSSSEDGDLDDEESRGNDGGWNSSGSDGQDLSMSERAHLTTLKESRKCYLAIPRWKKLKNNARGMSPDLAESSE